MARREIAAIPGGDASTLPRASATAGTHAPAPSSIEAFQDLQRARATLTVAEVLAFYRSKVFDFAPDTPALALVDSCIREAGITQRKIEERLEKLLAHAPSFAEAWYELGEIRLGNEDYSGAIACFDRCLTMKQAIPVPNGRTPCDALAAAGKAAALERSGSLEMAAEAYRHAAKLGSSSTLLRVARGHLLRRLGKPLDAAAEFDAGMESDQTPLALPPMPHDFSQLVERLVEVFRREDPSAESQPVTRGDVP
jgi:tetratricopeptide (TPR) repeat protein